MNVTQLKIGKDHHKYDNTLLILLFEKKTDFTDSNIEFMGFIRGV